MKDGDISRDTLNALALLSSNFEQVTFCLAGSEGVDSNKLEKLSTLPQNICNDFPESGLKMLKSLSNQ